MKAVQNKFGFIVFILFMLVLATMLGVLFTQGRYSEEAGHDSDVFDGDLEYIVAEQVEVRTADEFIAAVENGYSNIKIADEVDNPLIITEGVTDVGSDLILDLNGHEIQRNNREPMLNIVDGVRMTVIDTKGGGSFYNPVGSVLQIDGGTLTVAAGDFVSGPKKAEYYYESAVASEHTGGSISSFIDDAMVYTKSGDGYAAGDSVSVPVINPHISTVNNHSYVNGNMYFTSGWSNNAGLIPDDTYLYYVVDDDTVSHAAISSSSGSADFYYSYCINKDDINKDDYTSVVDEPADGESVIEVTVYGYYKVKNSAAGESGVTPDYATIKMLGGNMYARGGAYHSYFGVEHTYGIYASGGYMAVESGSAFEAIEGGVCVACNYDSQSSSEYLRISNGAFSSDYGDTVRVSGGEMVVTGGRFEKDTTGAPEAIEDGEMKTSAALSIEEGGSLDMSSDNKAIAIAISGSYARGIYANGGEIDISNANITFSGYNGKLNDSTGIYASGGTVTATDLTVDMENNDSVTSGSGNYGIFAAGGTVGLSGNVTLNVVGSHSVGIYASSPDSAVLSDEPYNITYDSGDTVNADVSGDTVNADEAAPSLTVNVSGALNNETLTSTAISTQGGGVMLNGNAKIESDGLGITAQGAQDGSGGNIVFGEKNGNSYTYEVTTTKGTAIYVNGGSITFASGIVNVKSTIEGKYGWNGTTAFYDGICVQGGSLDASASGAVLNVTHKGIANEDYKYYDDLVVKSFAVRVISPGTETSGTTSNVTISAGTLTNEIGGGLYVSGGETTLGNVTIQTTGTETSPGYFNATSESEANNWHYKKNVTGGHAVEVNGGELTVNDGIYSAAMGNGILVSGGITKISGGIFSGADSYSEQNNNGKPIAGPAASYALKMYGGKLTVENGTFGEGAAGSGAFITGGSSDDKATITGGKFNVNGQAGLVVYNNAEVILGDENANDAALQFSGLNAGMTIEGTGAKVTINSGVYYTYSADVNHNSDGIWYNSPSSKLTITGGTFIGGRQNIQVGENGITNVGDAIEPYAGYSAAGLLFYAAPNEKNVQISGGEFYGGQARYEDGTTVREVSGGGIGVYGSYSENFWGNLVFDTFTSVKRTNIIAEGATITVDNQIGDISNEIAGDRGRLGLLGNYGLAHYTYIKIE